MEVTERIRIISMAIRKMEERLLALEHGAYDGIKPFEERNLEMRDLAHHIFWANQALHKLIAEESKESA